MHGPVWLRQNVKLTQRQLYGIYNVDAMSEFYLDVSVFVVTIIWFKPRTVMYLL